MGGALPIVWKEKMTCGWPLALMVDGMAFHLVSIQTPPTPNVFPCLFIGKLSPKLLIPE